MEHIGTVAARVIDGIGHRNGWAKIKPSQGGARVEFLDKRGIRRKAELTERPGEDEASRLRRIWLELKRAGVA